MSPHADQRRQELIDRLIAGLPQDAGCFAQLFYAGAPAADLDCLGVDELAAGAASIWSFAERRQPGEIKIRAATGGPDGDAPWCSAPLALEIVSDDMPFLVASLSGLMERLSLTVELLLHPVIAVTRAADGRRGCLGDGKPESLIQIRLNGLIAPDALERAAAAVIGDVRAATSDWRQMLHRLSLVTAELDDPALTDAGVPDADVAEAKAFLHWVADNHFTLLGYRDYRYEQTPSGPSMAVAAGSGLGVLRDPDVQVFEGARNLWELPAEVRAFLEAKTLLIVHKSDRRSTVHRNVHMDVIGLKRLDADGKVVAEHRFVGLFTSSAYNQPPQTIPLLRRKVEAVIAGSNLNPNSHDGKALLQILETYPRDELFSIDPAELREVALGVLAVQERRRIALFVRKDPFGRFVSCLVYVPRDRYDFELREKFHRILTDAWGGTLSASFLLMGDAPLARMRVIVKTKRGQIPDVDVAALERKLIDTGRSWRDHLASAARRAGLKDTAVLARYGAAFGPGYAERFDVDDAIADIPRIEAAAAAPGRPVCWLHRHADARPAELNVRLYRSGSPILLSDVLPMLENRGLRVLTEAEYRVCAADLPQPVWLHDFRVESLDGQVRDLVAAGDRFRDGFLASWTGEAEEDGFNRLILAAGLSWRDAAMFRAFAKYLKQVGFPYSQSFLEQTLARHGAISAKLAALFHAKFTPVPGPDPVRVAALTAEIERLLDDVSALDEDKALRRFLNLIQATLRTNAFQPGADGQPKPYLAFKLDSRAVEDLPKPRPFVEVWVYSPRVEAIHLRGGPAARGGIRWSDRREDFRTEILGLMKAQMVKNAVIVPVGSKGGFVVKRPPDAAAGRAALQAEVIACYKTLMFGLLDLTDNRVGHDVVPPPSVVRYDGDDPYLVVAADKGTATFSDIANGVSQDYGFWLDDAFASGGSAGYDHKKLGITARGAWVAARRHFREMGVDLDTAPVGVVGVGDMSGDVFGNGMLRSAAIKLVGAFNHLHIFIDPDPDPAAAYQERLRLFQTPGTAWSDYNPALISAGGGVWPRSAKTIPLSPQIQALLGLSVDHLTPAELIQALLRAPVDLIWFGGIGAYVKAEAESHAEVGDRANDAVRVDAKTMRAKVIAEGANLGVTQRGRLEFAAQGGRINTDAIDNSAGVDMSDHEVNIKILLADPAAKAALDRPARDALLAQMADEVSDHVLRDNFEQTLAISAAEKEGAELVEAAVRLIAAAERANGLDRALEALPSDSALLARKTAGGGLLRPELAVLLAHAKILVYNALLASDLPDDPALHGDLVGYFPAALQQAFPEPLGRHGLRREITATALTNQMVARGGIAFASELAAETGAGLAEIARRFVIARRLFDLPTLWGQIDAVDDPALATAQMEAHRAAARIAATATRWLLAQELTGPINDSVAILAPPVTQLIARAPATPPAAQGLPEDLAERLGRATAAVKRLSVVGLSRALGVDAGQAAEVYFAVAGRFGFDLLANMAAAAPTPDAWVKRAMRGVIDDAERGCARVAAAALQSGGVERWSEAQGDAVRRAERAAAELAAGPPTMARLVVAERELREAFAHV